MAPASEPTLTKPEEVQEAIRGLKVSQAPGPNAIPSRALKRLLQRAVSLLDLIFKAFLTHQSIPYSLVVRSNDLYTETGEGSSTAIIL